MGILLGRGILERIASGVYIVKKTPDIDI